jgi:hypothetical protein
MGVTPGSTLRSGRARKAVPAAILLAAVVGSLGLGMRSASAKTTAQATAVRGLSLPLDQWLATGRISAASGTNVVHAGDVLVRAWYFNKVCPAHGSCYGQFVRQLSGGGAQSANIQAFPSEATASFPPTIVACSPGATAQGTEHDSFSWRQAPANGRLDAVLEVSTFTGCGSTKASALVSWNAVTVPLAPAPKFTPAPTHSTTVAVFRQTLTRVCSNVNAELVPLTTQMSKDESALKAAARPPATAAASAAASLAKLYPQILPILMKDYVSVPQPPVPLSADWLRYGELQRQELPEVSSALVALTNVFSALSLYERTGSLLAAQTALAEESLAGADQNGYYALHQSATALAKQLALPTICTNPPALQRAGGYIIP